MLQLLASSNLENSLKALKLGGLAMLGIFVVMLVVFITISLVNKAGNGEIKLFSKIKEKISETIAKIKPKNKKS